MISLLISISISYIWYVQTLDNAEASAVNYMDAILRQSNDNLDDIMGEVNSIVTLLAFDNEIRETFLLEGFSSKVEELTYERKLTEILYRISSFRSNIRGIMVANFDGRFYEFGTTMLYEDILQQPWFNSIFSDMDKTIIPPHYYQQNHQESKSDSQRIISIARPLYDKEKVKKLGFIIADIRSGILQKTFNMELEDDASIFIRDNHTNEIIFESTSNALSLEEHEFDDLKFQGEKGILRQDMKGKSYVMVYYHSTFANWTTIGVISEEHLLKDYYHTLRIVFLVSACITLVIIVLIYLMSDVLTKNIRKLNKAMNKVTKDNLDVGVAIKTRDEIGDLSHQFNYLTKRISRLIKETKENEKAKKQAELKALKAQINPHFLFNTLNTIKFLAMMQKADNITLVSESLSTLMHVNMDKRHFITLDEEITYLKSYLDIQKYKYNNKYTYSFHVDVSIDQYYIPKLILQPLVENALIHGFSGISTIGKLYIRMGIDQEKLTVDVVDNGCGMDPQKTHQGGIGVVNIKERLHLYFGDGYGLTIDSKADYYTKATVTLPLLTKEAILRYD